MGDAISVQDERCGDEIVGHKQMIPRPKAEEYVPCPQLVTAASKQPNSTLHFQVLSDDTYDVIQIAIEHDIRTCLTQGRKPGIKAGAAQNSRGVFTSPLHGLP